MHSLLEARPSELDFDLACEWPKCDANAAVTCRGCSDERHYLICSQHLAMQQQQFALTASQVPVPRCATCFRPWMFFETHYEVTPL